MSALAGAVSTQDLLSTYDCRTWSCVGEAREPGGLCVHCARLATARRQEETLAWRRLVRTLDPPAYAACSPLLFQAVAAALADYVGLVDPSVDELSRASRASTRSVQAALAALEKLDLLRRDARGGRGRTTRYALRRPAQPR